MCVWLPATHLEPGAVEAQGAPLSGLLQIGRYPSGADAVAERIAADLEISPSNLEDLVRRGRHASDELPVP